MDARIGHELEFAGPGAVRNAQLDHGDAQGPRAVHGLGLASRFHDQRLRTEVLQIEVVLLPSVVRVERCGRRTGGDRDERRSHLRTVGEHDADPVPPSQSHRVQGRDRAVCVGPEPRVVESAPSRSSDSRSVGLSSFEELSHRLRLGHAASSLSRVRCSCVSPRRHQGGAARRGDLSTSAKAAASRAPVGRAWPSRTLLRRDVLAAYPEASKAP